MRDTAYFGSNTERFRVREIPVSLQLGDIRKLTADFSAYCGIEDTVIDDASWSIENNSNSIGIGSATTTSKTTYLMATAELSGISQIKCAVTMDNGELLIVLFRVSVEDPIPVSLTDYCG